MSAKKKVALQELAKRRQRTRVDDDYPGYFSLQEFAGGNYECDFVSPWSKSAQNVDASVMVVGQDWASETELRGPINRDRVEIGYDPTKPTNKNLQDLLRRHLGMEFHDVYATNAFPFIKAGKMQGKEIEPDHLIRAIRTFLLAEIEIIEPELVICLGLSVYNGLREACGYGRLRTITDAISTPFQCNGSAVIAVAHTGTRGRNNRGSEQVQRDWATISPLLKK